MRTKKRRSQNSPRANKKRWWWISGVVLALAIFGMSILYLTGFFARKLSIKLPMDLHYEDPRFPLLVVSLSNALPTSVRLTDFY